MMINISLFQQQKAGFILGRIYDNYVYSYLLSEERDADFFDIIRDLYYSDEVQGLKIYPQHSNINRLDHITSVAYTSYCWAKKSGLDVRSTVRGAILHDLFYYDWHDKAYWHRPHGYKHPRFALNNARVLNKEITAKEENIILRHMWPLTVIPPKYKEGIVVSLCDKYCATNELLIADHEFFRKRFEEAKKRFGGNADGN